MPGPYVKQFQDDIVKLGNCIDEERQKRRETFDPNYCQPDGVRGCARMTLKRWFGKCPDCPCLKRAGGMDVR